MRWGITTRDETRTVMWVLAQSTTGRATLQMRSGTWRSLTKSHQFANPPATGAWIRNLEAAIGVRDLTLVACLQKIVLHRNH